MVHIRFSKHFEKRWRERGNNASLGKIKNYARTEIENYGSRTAEAGIVFGRYKLIFVRDLQQGPNHWKGTTVKDADRYLEGV